MNFIEAVQLAKSGYEVKRQGWADGVKLFVSQRSGYGEDTVLVCHVAACAIPLTATDVLAQDWEMMRNLPDHLPSWFRVGREIKHIRTQMVYRIDEIGSTSWKAYDGDRHWNFSTIGITGNWIPVE